jgi:UDP-GlcNAc:undecaprenyl-phosphate/decaprenyl-phosphate GlcNAc-1-phosphate transferase
MEVPLLSLTILLALATSAVITAFDIPVIISLAYRKKLIDIPDNKRKLHKQPIPALGGIAIFIGIIISFSLWVGKSIPVFYPYLVAGSVLLFTVGVNDDILEMNPWKKLIAQILASAVIVIGGKVRLDFLDGLLGFGLLPEFLAITFTIFAFVLIINAFNLIDGVDGLAATMALIGAIFFCIWFFVNSHAGESILAASLTGALIGFLYYNRSPAKIFMGDTGSLIVGLIMAVMAFRLIELNSKSSVFAFEKPTVFALSLLIIPMADTIRVIIVRLMKKKSPFFPDRNHIHHKLLEMGFGHRNICRFLTITHLGIIGVALFLYSLEIHLYLLSIWGLAFMIIPTAHILKRWQARIKFRLRERKLHTAAMESHYSMKLAEKEYRLEKKVSITTKAPSYQGIQSE